MPSIDDFTELPQLFLLTGYTLDGLQDPQLLLLSYRAVEFGAGGVYPLAPHTLLLPFFTLHRHWLDFLRTACVLHDSLQSYYSWSDRNTIILRLAYARVVCIRRSVVQTD